MSLPRSTFYDAPSLKADDAEIIANMITICDEFETYGYRRVGADPVCRRLMTVPSVGPLVAITYKSAMDDPSRIAKSKAAGALFGLTPKKYQSGEKDVTGGITRTGDEMVRTALYEAANVLLSRITRFSKLKRWGNGRRQAARFKASEGRLGSQDRSNPAPYMD